MSYKGDLTGGALLIKETKKLAPYLLSNIQKEDFINAIFNDNLLETRAYITGYQRKFVWQEQLNKVSSWQILCDML